jgi:hypothetical protein
MFEKLVFYVTDLMENRFFFSDKRIFLEIYFGEKNIIAFCVSERFPNKKKYLLTNLYFYPSSNIVWLIFQEIKTRKYLRFPEILSILLTCFKVVNFFDKVFSKKKRLSKIEFLKTIEYLEKIVPNIQINLM